MCKFGIKKLVAAFGYEQVLLGEGELEINQMPWPFLEELYNYLVNLVGWKMGDNKVCFIWEGEDDGLFHAISFWDYKATYVRWGKLWGRGNRTPDNFIRGKEEVEKAIWKYLRPSVSSLEANLF